jgi:hypothetical protein
MGIADLLANGAKRAEDLAAEAGAHLPSLRRILRVLVARGVLELVPPELFALTPVGALLRRDHRWSLLDACMLSPLETRAWGAVVHSLRTGRSAFERVYGEDHRSYRAKHAEEDARMDRVHRAASRIDLLTAVRLYEWPSVRSIVDVGGGTGTFLAGLLARFTHLRGVLFDLPQMLENAPPVLAGAGVAERCEVVAGDFFREVPAGADVYILKAVLGGWAEQPAARILRTVRAAMRADSRLLVIEPVMEYGAGFGMGNVVHLRTLVLYGGPDRTLDDYGVLFAGANLRLSRLIPRPTLPILEVVPT